MTQPHAKVEVQEDGSLAASVGSLELRVEGGKIFNRNAVKKSSDGNNWHVRWLDGEVDGVRLYISGGKLLMTKRDIYP